MNLITAEIREKNLQNIKDSILPTTKIMAVTKTLSHKAIESAIKHKIYLIGDYAKIHLQKILDDYSKKKLSPSFIDISNIRKGVVKSNL